MSAKNMFRQFRTKPGLIRISRLINLYLKFLYEYFKDELSQTDEVFVKYLPQEFKKLEYQEQAVLNAKKDPSGIWWCFYFGCCWSW